ncbi:uncharacterized protein BDZ83DRAFT_440262 [Colletotrichum acutatum]|uniref:Uncharacterized protein n=1 Tax=Glomerella acutata TaxID=27357 RepID=A0AAD8UK88_GLOAC|nr:uncharacterized protein BDZ83DRAFT_440262 [Colletotrichum acutatum]KAK1721294.1 hypothetical protein BDZ83DRAFT_440262 [Colletotrichum acutatum]
MHGTSRGQSWEDGKTGKDEGEAEVWGTWPGLVLSVMRGPTVFVCSFLLCRGRVAFKCGHVRVEDGIREFTFVIREEGVVGSVSVPHSVGAVLIRIEILKRRRHGHARSAICGSHEGSLKLRITSVLTAATQNRKATVSFWMRGVGAGNWLMHVAIARGGVERDGRMGSQGLVELTQSIRTSTARHLMARYSTKYLPYSVPRRALKFAQHPALLRGPVTARCVE